MIRDCLPQLLKTLRQNHGFTLDELAEKTKLSISYLSDLERGRTSPSIATLERIAAGYGLDVFISFDAPLIPPQARKHVENAIDLLKIALLEDV